MTKAIIAGAYAIAEPDLYVDPDLAAAISKQAKRPSLILFYAVIRNLVSSVADKRLSELDQIVGILYFDIDPAKSLGDYEYAFCGQCVNLMTV